MHEKKTAKNNHTGATKRDALKRKTTNNERDSYSLLVCYIFVVFVYTVKPRMTASVDDSGEYNM